MRVTNHSSSGMSGEPSCTGVRPTWWWPLTKPGSRISWPVPITGTVGCACVQVLVGADRRDDAVLLQHRAVGDLLPVMAVEGAGDHGAAADQDWWPWRLLRKFSGQAVAASASCSAKARSTSSRSSSVSCRRSASASGENGSRGRGRSIGHDGLDPPGPGGEHHDAVGERHRLVDVMGDEQHRGAAVAPDVEQEVLHLLARVCTSSAAKGSSISSTFGRMASARATATRWRMPPDNSSGRLSIASARPTRCSASRGDAAALGLPMRRGSTGRS